MYIQEITIEGFKSYAQRVTLPNFDPTFNAITGLNGTGKSNILDSICFVMGIKTLAHVRATNLQELVYKQGQAGITKATVSITFHNNDPKTGPSGYDDKEYITITRQIVIGGRNKYLINGHVAQENRVQDLFHSVQLNVNNPHFLIMQGSINKVCNMKPAEIMSLLEEAAGTRMYEKKKEVANKTLEKKDQKLKEIDDVLKDDILPSLELLRKQCEQYNEWAALSSNKERLRRFLVAYDYMECSKLVTRAQSDVAAMQNDVAQRQANKEKIQAKVEEQQAMVRDLQTEKDIQMGGEMKELQKAADELSMKLTKDTTGWKNKKENMEAEQGTLKQLKAALKELAEQDMEGKVAKAKEDRDTAKAALEAAEHAVEAATRELAGAEAGDGRDESNRSLQERLADAQNAQTAADGEMQQADIRAKHLQKQLAEQKKALSTKDKETGTLQKDLQKHQGVVEECTRRLQGLSFNEAEMQQLEEARDREVAEVRRCKDEVDRLSQEVAGCDFKFSDPRAGFDRSRVRGVLAKLVHVKDPATSVALEVAAGGKLYQVVVEDEVTAKELLERGRLTKRVTIIPLNKIQYFTPPNSVLDAAKKLGGDKVHPAIQLVGYEADVERAMKYAFGSVFVCQDAGTAKKLAFSREVGQRCVTLEGDDFNPSGLLTGGSRNTSRSVLALLHELAAAEQKLTQHSASLQEVDRRLAELSGVAKEYRRLKQELDLKQHSLALLQERIANSEAAQLAASVEQLQQQLAEAQQQLDSARAKKQELVALAKSLEREIQDFSKDRDKRLKAAQDKLKKAKSEVEARRKEVRRCEQRAQEAQAEMDAAAEEVKQLEVKVVASEQTIKGLEAEVAALLKQVENAKAEHARASSKLEERRARLKECDSEITGLEKQVKKLAASMQDIDMECKRIDNKIKGKLEEGKKCAEHVAKLEKEYKWLLAERDSFGRGDYDFERHDPNKAHAEFQAVEKRLEELKSKINQKDLVHSAAKLEKAEAEYQALQEKRTIVANDRKRITEVITELDEKKKLAMKETWLKVNQDFGSIFSTLLPGAKAKLEPPEGQTFLDGLDMRVAFGDVWKESLTELSGGQRSLLALSLILALCRFKPAPLYILDEVDSALDLNNSQNIGRMIKQHFPQSQFLVVSHKDGFFNNANIIFRTKFVDGVSAVSRTVVQQADRIASGAVAHPVSGKGASTSGQGRSREALKESNRAA